MAYTAGQKIYDDGYGGYSYEVWGEPDKWLTPDEVSGLTRDANDQLVISPGFVPAGNAPTSDPSSQQISRYKEIKNQISSMNLNPNMSAADRAKLHDLSIEMYNAGGGAGLTRSEIIVETRALLEPATRTPDKGYATFDVSTIWRPINPGEALNIGTMGGAFGPLNPDGSLKSSAQLSQNLPTAFSATVRKSPSGSFFDSTLGKALKGVGMVAGGMLGANLLSPTITGLGATGLSGPGSGMWAGMTMAQSEAAIMSTGGAIGFGAGAAGTGSGLSGLLSSASKFMSSPAGGAVQMAGGVATGNPISILTGALTLAGKPLPMALNIGLNLAGAALGGGLFGGEEESQTQEATALTAQVPTQKIAAPKVPDITPFNMEAQFEEEERVMEEAERRERVRAKRRTGRFSMRRTDQFSLSNPFIYTPSLSRVS